MLARVLLCMVVVFCLLAVVTLTEVVVGLVAVLVVCGGSGWVAEVMMDIPLCSFKVLAFFVFVLAFYNTRTHTHTYSIGGIKSHY